MPSTSDGARPASARASRTASQASCSSLRPESLENSVAPMPAMAATPPRRLIGRRPGSSTVTVPVTWSPRLLRPRDGHLDRGVVDGGDPAGEDHRVAGVVGHAQAHRHLAQAGRGAGPVGDVAPDQSVGGEDVHEDVGRALLLGQFVVVVHVLVVARGDGRRDDERAGEGHRELGELVAHVHLAGVERRGASSGRSSRGCLLDGAIGDQVPQSRQLVRSASPSVSSICLAHRKKRWTG